MSDEERERFLSRQKEIRGDDSVEVNIFLNNFVWGAAFEPRSVFSRVIQPCNQAAASCQLTWALSIFFIGRHQS